LQPSGDEVVFCAQVLSMHTWKQRVRQLKQETYAIYLACKDPRVPWYTRVFAGFVVAYAFSPLDLIPDFIPILGYLDDLVLVPLGIILVLKMIPPAVLVECRQKAEVAMGEGKPTNWIAAGVIVAIWLLVGILAVLGVGRILKR
jgi:uncharacterized membrane protein YkvA (DUF1232 family)